MKHTIALVAALLICAGPVFAAEPVLTPEHQASLRCSAVFALVAADQARGLPSVQSFPLLGVRGKEFFVRTGARVMDETGANRAQVQALLASDAAAVQHELARAPDRRAALDRIMQPCLALLDLTVLPAPRRTR